MPLPVRHASEPTQIMPRAWESRGPCNWLHAQLPMQHRKFLYAEKIKKSILMQIHVCNVFDASCCAARIRSHLNNAASMEIKGHLQLVACAAADAAQEFFVCRKNQEKSILMKIDFATFSMPLPVRHASEPTQIMPRAWESRGPCNWFHAQLPMQHRKFLYAEKIKKIDFDAN